ncbi:MAG: alanyl-tRNA editing protein, partial [Firmicutes bacterium]|nr:alanyl-tRNA editing protein [Bacillota bacterium]
MKTKKVYYDDVYMSNGTGNVLEILTSKEHSSAVSLVLDQTIFFPTGGGQSCDLGTINGLPVIDVREDKDAIYHVVDIGDKDVNNIFHVGDEVSLAIDWERRFDNMQRHCGEHILSGIFYKLFGGVNRGFHMGDDYLTIDISLEDKPEFKELSMDMCLEAELMANQAIWDNLPVVRKVFDSREEAVKMPLRKALAIDEDISIVTIGDENDPADSVACCGTHPAYAGQVGMIKIYKVEPNKGMFRIFFEAGKRALLAYDKQYDILTKLGNDLSAGVPD